MAEREAELVPRLWEVAGPGGRCAIPASTQACASESSVDAHQGGIGVASGWLPDAELGADAWI